MFVETSEAISRNPMTLDVRWLGILDGTQKPSPSEGREIAEIGETRWAVSVRHRVEKHIDA
jgi:hypothetical protein